MAASFTIMCFSWNASGLRLCETMSQTKADVARTGIKAFITMKKKCLAPDFFEDIRETIRNKRPSLVIMTTEDEDSSGSYFHSDLLVQSMPEIGYTLVKKDKLNNIGETASGVTPTKVVSGTPSGSALRVSIYATNEVFPGIISEEKVLQGFFNNDGQKEMVYQQGDRVSGAIASYIWHETYGKFAFISTHLPAGVNSFKVGKDLDYRSYRAVSRAANNLCLISVMNQLVDSLPMEAKPDHIFLIGDLNYDIFIPNKKNIDIVTELAANISPAKIRDLQKYDELKKALDDVPLNGFKEGVSGEGPLFLPNWRLAKGRGKECVPEKNATKISTSCFGEPNDAVGGLGWHDRILYKEMMTSNFISHCIDYNRIDIKNMHASSHAGVVAFFEIRSVL